MDYIEAKQKNNDTVLIGVRFFDLAQTLDNGQAFRWRTEGEQKFVGIAHGRRLEIFFENGDVTLRDVSLEELEKTWKEYFDLSRDYAGFHKLSTKTSTCENLRAALEFSPGLRLLKQDVFEVLISFILSQNSNIPRIKKMVEALCENFGTKLQNGFAFPKAERLAVLSEENLAPVRCGYRAAYVIDAARRVAHGEFSPEKLQSAESGEIFEKLLQIHGVGPKVAECVLLYGFGRAERYPADVWIKRAMAKYFPHGFPDEIKNYSGIAQQFLFHYVRNN
jgi:N-glycosylase/DNA lyase